MGYTNMSSAPAPSWRCPVLRPFRTPSSTDNTSISRFQVPRYKQPLCRVASAVPPDAEPTTCFTLDRRSALVGAAVTLSTTPVRPSKAQTPKESQTEDGVATAVSVDDAAALGGEASSAAEKRRAHRKPLPNIPKAKLTKGLEVSKLIRGTWQLGGSHKGDSITDRTSGPAVLADLETMFKAGMTTIDTADVYGQSEAMIGQYMRLYPWRREGMQLMTKMTVDADDVQSLSANMVEYRVRAALQRLGTHYVDVMQLHWDGGSSSAGMHRAADVARWLMDLQAGGLVRSVGVANFSAKQLLQLIDAGVKPVSNQVEYSVMDRRPDLHLQAVCSRHNVAMLPYGVLAGGFLADRYLGKAPAQVHLNTLSKQKYGTQIAAMGGWSWFQQLLQVLQVVAKKHKTTVSAVAIRWVLDQPCVPAAIIGARNASHMKDLQRVLTLQLDDVDMLDIDAVAEGANQPTHDVYEWERGASW